MDVFLQIVSDLMATFWNVSPDTNNLFMGWVKSIAEFFQSIGQVFNIIMGALQGS